VGGRILFDAGNADLTPQAVKQLDQTAVLIRGHLKIAVVKGHTSLDDLPESASAQDRMNLSVKRAQVVADYLTACGVEPQVLRVQGCSTFEPIVQHVYGVGSRLVNRRVEVEATESLVADRQGDSTKPTTHAAPVHEPVRGSGD
jgi:outer membrane protein OmpA-like peptidoglycan-associated protein